ncbi:hypothetical protein OG914_09355 [Streptomyces sp. NBC_00291]|uniref:hypothetical protein n=1 Tax=Streptomyces sp. NBC_00291 TaxID=2975704 RepID=UPI0022548F0B|nr:hypothetical protein [Streptomyces sp. NBC_00291]MCX5154194.1 hypothetical protein [Streptomyces sp. NBC_00291]
MTSRGEGVQNETGWAWECDPGRLWVLGHMPAEQQRLVGSVMDGLVDLASMGIDPKDGSLYEDEQPMRLRTYEDEHLMLWYQTIPHRSRVYLKRVNL